MDEPLWWKLINLDASEFEKSRYADPGNPNKFRLKDLGKIRKLAPGLYESCVGEVKEYNDYLAENDGGKFKKTKLGKKIGSIPMMEAFMHPELLHDKKAQDKYFTDNPELRAR